MPKSLLALALTLTQLLSWSAAPVYLCLESDGSIRVDSGPEHCDCHRAGELDDHFHLAGADCRTASADGDHHEHGCEHSSDPESDSTAAPASCDCTHIQICVQQSPMDLLPAASADTGRLAASCVASYRCLNSAALDRDAVSFWHGLSPPGSWRQCGRLPVVLRC